MFNRSLSLAAGARASTATAGSLVRVPQLAALRQWQTLAATRFSTQQQLSRSQQQQQPLQKQPLLQSQRLWLNASPALRAPATAGHKRPTSPHVTIYDFPISAISSISNRAAGAGLAGILFLSAMAANSGHPDIASCIVAFRDAAPILVPFAKFILSWPLVYHFVAGLRHFMWDAAPHTIEVARVSVQSRQLLIASVVISAILSFVYL